MLRATNRFIVVRRLAESGFSLVEILVATTILALIVTLLGGIVSSVGTNLRMTIGRSECGLSARAIADYIQTDLKAALLPINSGSDNLQFILNPPSLPDEYKNCDALFWQSPVANNTTYGDIAEVGYFVKWITDSRGNKPLPVLCRFFIEPSASGVASDYKIYEEPANWIHEDIIKRLTPADANGNYAGLFAENVVAIWFRCFDHKGVAFHDRIFDSRVGAMNSVGVKRSLPASVQVSFVLIDSRTSSRLTPNTQTALTNLAEKIGAAMAAETTQNGEISPAEEFVNDSLADPGLKSISAGLKAHTTTISLDNAK